MVRRRITKSRARPKSKHRPINKADGKVNKWDKRSDIPLDEEDEFHENRDRILLGGGGGSDEDVEEDEVFGLKGLSDEGDEDEDEDMEGDDLDTDDDNDDTGLAKPHKKSQSKRSTKTALDVESSEDEEVDESWGRGKSAFYSSNANELDSDDEEANELEEQEARRLQAKARDSMRDEDFGLHDVHDVAIASSDDDPVEAPAVQLTQIRQDKKSLLRQLEKTNPLALALARDWEDTARNLVRTRAKLDKIAAEQPEALSLGMLHLHYQTLLTYTNTLAFYLYLRASEKYARQPKLLDSHPITNRLLTLKQSLATLEELDFATSDSEDDSEDENVIFGEDKMWSDANQLWSIGEDAALEAGELADLLMDAGSEQTLGEHRLRLRAATSSDTHEPPAKKRKTSKPKTNESSPPVFDLVEPDFPASDPTKSSSRRISQEDNSHDIYGELSSLDYADAADKTARKKSLRFHTSRIEGVSARRQGARNRALGGDDDIPYKERRKESRLAKETGNSRGQGGADLDDTDPEPRGEDHDVIMEDADGYYELVKKTSKQKKEHKKAEYEASTAAARADIAEGGVEGPRSLTRAILKNKGLTPHRSKSVRNPRVKKRQKFEKAKRKVASQKAIFKGGLNATGGRYDGEKTGISKVVKSIRLS